MAKIQIGSSDRRSSFKKDNCDCTTTMSFGAFQPLFCAEIVPDQTTALKVNTFVRLAPLVKPTYGRCNLHHYTTFTKICDVYHPWESFLAKKSYNGGESSYIPTVVPCIRDNFLLSAVLCLSTLNVFRYKLDGTAPVERVDLPMTGPNINVALSYLYKGCRLSAVGISEDDFRQFANSLNPYLLYLLPEKSAKDDFDAVSTSADFELVFAENGYNYCVFCRLSDMGKNLRNTMLGLGWQLNGSSVYHSILPLFAYYKSWFELFAPQRFITYKDTNLYKLIEYIERTNNVRFPDDFTGSYLAMFGGFLYDVCHCYYTSPTDYVSAHHTGVSTNNSAFNMRADDYDSINDNSIGVGDNKLPRLIGPSSSITRSKLRVLNFITKFVNADTYLGGRIDKILRVLYGSSSEERDSHLVNSYTTSIEISDVMNQAETGNGVLGEYAGQGQGIGFGKTNKHFSKRQYGFLIHFCAVVPNSNYSQALDPCLNHINRFDFYTPGYDGLTLVPTRKQNIFGACDRVTDSDNEQLALSFGNVPIYSEYKTHYSILNGDMSLHSTRDSMLPFSFDKLLPFMDFDHSADLKTGYPVARSVFNWSNIVNGTLWRYIGLYRWLGNYERIFYDQPQNSQFGEYVMFSGDYRYDDNFIVHNFIEYSRHTPMLPLGQSFDTGSDVNDKGAISAEIE